MIEMIEMVTHLQAEGCESIRIPFSRSMPSIGAGSFLVQRFVTRTRTYLALRSTFGFFGRP